MRSLPILLAVALVTTVTLTAANVGTSALTTIDTTDHNAAAASPRIEARAGVAVASPTDVIDTARPLAFILIVR